MLYAVLSGPQARFKHVQKAFKDAGLHVVLDDLGDPLTYDWGIHPSHDTQVVDGVPTPVESQVPVLFLTVETDSHDRAHEVADQHGWRLRAHFDKPEAAEKPAAADVLRRLGLDAADLRALLAEA